MENRHWDFFKNLANTISPSGFEREAVSVWKDYARNFSSDVKVASAVAISCVII